jgi:hypothetical protein
MRESQQNNLASPLHVMQNVGKINRDGRKAVENYTMLTLYRNVLENSIVGKEKLWENTLCLKEIVGNISRFWENDEKMNCTYWK